MSELNTQEPIFNPGSTKQEMTESTQPLSATDGRRRFLLIGGLMVALAVTLLFGLRLVRHLAHRPAREPIRPWMSIPQVAHAYRIPPAELFNALGLPVTRPPDLRPIGEIARAQNRSIEEVIRILEERIRRGPPALQPSAETPPP